MRLERDAFELSEISDRWGVSAADLRFLVASDKLTLSVRILAQPARLHAQELSEGGDAYQVPLEERPYTGLADLSLQDAFRMVRDGACDVGTLHLPGGRVVELLRPGGLRLGSVDLLVRREHADQLEGELIGAPLDRGNAFDFRMFVYSEREFSFTLPQARALEFMLAQTRAGAPDQHHANILKAVGSASQRLSSLFSRKPHWVELLRKTPGQRGWYHLAPEFVVWLIASD